MLEATIGVALMSDSSLAIAALTQKFLPLPVSRTTEMTRSQASPLLPPREPPGKSYWCLHRTTEAAPLGPFFFFHAFRETRPNRS